jgi:hypothetical protein
MLEGVASNDKTDSAQVACCEAYRLLEKENAENQSTRKHELNSFEAYPAHVGLGSCNTNMVGSK